jgi:isochorismate hydrolase
MTQTNSIPTIEPYLMPTVDDLPRNIARWTVDPNRAILLLHDMQSYFLRPFPVQLREDLVSNAARLRSHCATLGVPVAYTMQPGAMTDAQRGLLKEFWGPGMRADTVDRQVVEPLRPIEDDWTFIKWRYSAFFRSNLLERMRENGRDQLVLCGVYAHVGVLTTAIDAFTNDIETFLIADAIADFSAKFHWLTIEYAAGRCAMVTTTSKIVP